MKINEMLENPVSGKWFDVAMRVKIGDNDVIALKLLKHLLEITPDSLTVGDVDTIINSLHWWHTTYAVLHENKMNDNYPLIPPPAQDDQEGKHHDN